MRETREGTQQIKLKHTHHRESSSLVVSRQVASKARHILTFSATGRECALSLSVSCFHSLRCLSRERSEECGLGRTALRRTVFIVSCFLPFTIAQCSFFFCAFFPPLPSRSLNKTKIWERAYLSPSLSLSRSFSFPKRKQNTPNPKKKLAGCQTKNKAKHRKGARTRENQGCAQRQSEREGRKR